MYDLLQLDYPSAILTCLLHCGGLIRGYAGFAGALAATWVCSYYGTIASIKCRDHFRYDRAIIILLMQSKNIKCIFIFYFEMLTLPFMGIFK